MRGAGFLDIFGHLSWEWEPIRVVPHGLLCSNPDVQMALMPLRFLSASALPGEKLKQWTSRFWSPIRTALECPLHCRSRKEIETMGILLAFAPFIVFVILERVLGPTAGLVAAALTSALLIGKDLIVGRKPKVLEAGTLILFAGLALYTAIVHPNWSVIAVRLRVDAGLLLVVVASMALKRPFTLQYAREQVASEFWSNPAFVRTNYVITSVWALAFALMVAAEAAILYVPSVPQKVGIWTAILAIYGAFRFTLDYPKRRQAAASI